MSDYFAHTAPGRPSAEWQQLSDHLRGVATGSSKAAECFDSQDWAALAGLWHDLGKYSKEFQNYLRAASDPDSHVSEVSARVDHSTAGAQYAASKFPVLGHLLAYPISGHHSGLLDGRSLDASSASLEKRLSKKIPDWTGAPSSILDATRPALPQLVERALNRRDGFSVAFFVRMIFSCLVDSDFLDTESFMSPDRAAQRPVWPPDILIRMSTALDQCEIFKSPENSKIGDIRRSVRDACSRAAMLEPGFFSLTVPTGGGKTLSSLTFALRHAALYGQRRVIYVAPFTTIIEQNADVFRQALTLLGPHDLSSLVLEHHSNLDIEERSTVSSRLASENWDAPLIVTTAVQFFESLYANRPSRCRKINRIANSVVILDEAQAMPVDLLSPTLRALDELVRNYKSSVVLCTATQPAIHAREDFRIGLTGVREIIPDPPSLYESLRRVNVTKLGKLSDSQLSSRLMDHAKVLCIVNTRTHARLLYDLLQGEDAFHLSAAMCPAHRTERLQSIQDRLEADSVCRVVSTQLVEAGVDIDFPVVYRSMCGVDSLAQASGRCNRHGSLDGLGEVFVFESEHPRSERFIRDSADSGRQILSLHEDPLSLAAVEHYFRLHYWQQSHRWDARDILGGFRLLSTEADRILPFSFDFASTADRYRLIDEQSEVVIVPWRAKGIALCDELRRAPAPPLDLLRRLQRYSVQIPRRTWQRELGISIELLHGRYPVLVSPEMHYSDEIGLSLERIDTSTLIV